MSAADPLVQRLSKLIEVGIALSAESDTQRLLETILIGAKELTHADGGTLYSVQEDDSVRIEIIRSDSLDFAMGGTTGEPVPFPPIPLYRDGAPNHANVVTFSVHNQQTVNIADAYDADGFDFSGTRAFDAKTGYRSVSFLTIPMKSHTGDVIGVLQLLNAQDGHGKVTAFSPETQRLAEALASQAAIALTNRRLIDDLEALFESLVQLIATAIDDKSPYTGGHCRRVPVITMMLADAAAACDDGSLRDFAMSPEQRYELEIAAWLHDCGKISTPEYVVDKATKLETICDRMQMVESRFAALKSQLENDLLRRQVAALESGQPFPAEQEHRRLRERFAELDAELAFLRRVNLGGEAMDKEDQNKVREIAAVRWHDAFGKSLPLLSDDEVYNLLIPRGTLNPEEREIINGHIETTIRMLESLPLPKHLRNVPEYAGGHHERMDGKGYPRGLTGEKMSVQARTMAIADIFEALTAADRPYKRAKTLSESLRIMHGMKTGGHIDPELFDLFVRERLYLRYAQQFLKPEQMDEVDEAGLLQ